MSQIRMVERLMRLFSKASGYSAWIVDLSGNLVIEPVFVSRESEQVFENSGRTLLPLSSRVLNYGARNGPILIDCDDSGWQLIVTIFHDDDGVEQYLCAGPVSMEADKHKLVEQTEDLKQMLTVMHRLERADQLEKRRGSLLEYVADKIQTRTLDASSALDILLHSGLRIDYAGYAGKGENFQYMVTHTAGEYGSQLEGTTFFAGEGFLGQVAVTGQTKWWTCSPRDPRTRYFLQLGIDPSTLFVFPVKKKDETAGMLFYGTVQGAGIANSDLHIHWGSLIGALLGEALVHREHKEHLEIQIGRVKTLVELAGVLTTVNSLKRVMYILVDMALNLTEGSRASICIVRPPYSDNVQMVSRGVPADRVEQLGNRLSNKYLNPIKTLPSHEPESSRAIDCPIVYKDVTIGAIAIECGEHAMPPEMPALLEALAAIGALAMERSIASQATTVEPSELLTSALSELDPAKSAIIDASREMAVSFARYLHLGEYDQQRIDKAASLLGYSPHFLRQAGIPDDLVAIIEEYRQLKNSQHDAGNASEANHTRETSNVGHTGDTSLAWSMEAKILFFVIRHTASVPTNRENTPDKEFANQFQAFLAYREMKSRELVAAGIRSGEPLTSDEMRLIDAAEFSALSPRELEVLALVTRGHNNKRIAETLFISEHTVKNHITNIFAKLGVTDRSQLIALAYSARARSKPAE